MIQDADLECDPQDDGALMEPLAREEADVVFGSRYLTRQNARCNWRFCGLASSRGTSSRTPLWITAERTKRPASRFFRRRFCGKWSWSAKQFEFCPEVTAKACRLGLSILEVPIRYHPRTVAEGKKIRWTDGWKALLTLWRFRKWRAIVARARVCNAPLRDVMGRWLDVGYRTGIIF